MFPLTYWAACPYTRVAHKNGTVDTVDLQDFTLINSYVFHLAG